MHVLIVNCQGLLADRIRHWNCNRKVVVSVPVHVQFTTQYRKELNLTEDLSATVNCKADCNP